MAVPRMVLAFGDRQVEVPPTDDIAQLQFAAEEAFGLQQETYSFFDAYGKVESFALERVLRMADGGTCRFEVHERTEWQRIRQLEERVDALSAKGVTLPSEVSTDGLEMRILSVVGKVVADVIGEVQRTEAKVENVLAPVIQSLALAQMDMKAKFDSLDMAALQCRLRTLDAQVENALAPLIQSLALSQMDVQEKFGSLDMAAVATRLDTLDSRITHAVSSLNKKDPAKTTSVPAYKLDLESEQDGSSPRIKKSPHKSGHRDRSQGRPTIRMTADGTLQWRDISSKLDKSSSKDWHQHTAKLHDTAWCDSMSASLSRNAGPRQYDRKPYSRSVPILPPVF